VGEAQRDGDHESHARDVYQHLRVAIEPFGPLYWLIQHEVLA
jgi:hypothetical protein